jgi:membrane protein
VARPRRRDHALVHTAIGTVITTSRRSLESFVELQGMDRSMALAGQAFAALMPLLIVVGAASPAGGDDLADSMIDRFDLTGEAADALRAAVATPADIYDSVNVAGVLLLVISALSFTRALQRLYVIAWRLPPLGMKGNKWGLAWLAAVSVFWSLQPGVVEIFDGAIAIGVTIALSSALWLFTPWILVGKTIRWQLLLPQALLTSAGLTTLAVASAVYLPRAVASAANQFGFIGVAFALLSWLFLAAFVLVAAAALGATIARPAGQ